MSEVNENDILFVNNTKHKKPEKSVVCTVSSTDTDDDEPLKKKNKNQKEIKDT